ncbi:AsmA family protein [Reyranella sp.]|uniref:AsmA family protein n=1 Tax=Reyranella sp. TaxID=1929291 RepID=UPI0025DCC64C|nr:AsmA family protein [Reyranella sp.]
MVHDNRKRLLIGASIVGLLVAALLALPAFIDANAYKPEIVAQVKRMTGRDITLEGPIRFSLLPTPRVELDGVRFSNLPGSKAPNMMEARSVTVRPSLLPLLVGDVEIAEVTLVEPKIVLEVNTAGKPNWEVAPSVAASMPTVAQPSSPKPSPPGRLTVENGTLTFSDSKAGLSVMAEKANFNVSAGSIDGPYALAGSAVVNDAPLKIDLAVSAKSAAGYAVDVALEAGGGKASFKGSLDELSPAARLSGRASASADNLVAFAETLIRIAGQPQPHLPPLLAGKFKFDGPVDLSPTSVAAKDFKLVLGEDSGLGSFALTLTTTVVVEARFTASRLDLDRWLAAIALPDQLAVPPPPTAPAASPAPRAQPAGPGWLAAFSAKLALDVDEVIYNKKPVRNLALELEARGGAVAVPKFAATLPGDLTVQVQSILSGDPVRPIASGDFSLSGPKLRETLAWLAVDVSSVPENKLTRLSVTGRMGSRGGNVQVSDAVFMLDDLKAAGGIVVNFTVPLSVVTHIDLDALDLDSYLPPADQNAAPSASPVASVTPILALLGPSIGFKLKVARINYRSDTVAGIDIDLERRAGTMVLNEFKVANLAGARIALRGAIASYWTPRPQADFAFDIQAPDMDRVLKLAGTVPAGMGALSMRGGIAGSWERLTLRDCTLNAMGWSVLANGALALPGAAQGTIKSASYKGSIVVNDQPIEASIDADLSGSKPVIAADLRTNALDFGKLGGNRPAQRPPRGMSTFESQPIGTPLRSIDGTLKVSVASLGGTPMPVGNTEIAATLKDGVLSVSHLKSGLYGGIINLAGVIDGSRPSLSFDFKGEANGLNIGDMLRRSSGSNEIGSLIRIAIDGSLTATGLELRGAGTTVAEIRASMAGHARLSGHVQTRADKFLQLLGSAATGMAGGVIDATLGNIMSVLGDKGGVGVGNLLNAISLVLNRFVNHDNPLSGDIEIANGVLNDKNLVLQGNRATARVVTHTNLANATTDTTINFMLAEEPATPYLIVTARGPLGSPSFHATRGSANDPPGVTGILQKLPHVPMPSISVPTPRIPNIFGR